MDVFVFILVIIFVGFGVYIVWGVGNLEYKLKLVIVFNICFFIKVEFVYGLVFRVL